MQSNNSSIDVNSSSQQIESEISALQRFRETTAAEKQLRREKKNSFAKSIEESGTQLNKISEQQKRFQRNTPTSTDQLFKFIGLTKGTGSATTKAIRKLLLQAAVKSEQDVKKIIQEESLKSLGCSQEQTYEGVTEAQAANFNTLPVSKAIYVPVQSLDLITLANGLLKQNINSPIGKILYESYPVSTQQGVYRPFNGPVPFPFNKLLYELTQSQNSFNQQYGTFYKGSSGQNLMDIKYVTENEFGVTGNYYKVVLLNRNGSNTNNIGEWLFDYYSTIKLFDTSDLTAQILNFLSQFMNMKLPASSGPIGQQSKFFKILQRILGLCFDQRTEIDVSGTAKVAELDGIDDSFFEFTEVDLRNIDLEISNVQNGVMEFVDCNNVKVPVDFNNLTSQLVDFKSQLSGQTIEEQVSNMEKIIDSLSQNPNWNIYLPASFNASGSISNNIIQNLAIAVASAALSPKVLLPIFILLKITESSYALSYNQAVTSASTVNQLGIQASNIISDSVQFIKKFKNFMVQVVSRIGAIFIKNLFEILKKDLLNIVTSVVKEIIAEKRKKDYKQALRLIQLGIAVNLIQGFLDYRKCKSLLDEIKNILSLLSKIPTKRKKVPLPLAILSDFLPGESPQRAFLNTIKYMEEAGLPTGLLPDGSPNLNLIFNYATHRGRSDEQAENGVNDTYCYEGFCWSVPR